MQTCIHTTCLDFRGKAPCCYLSFSTVHFCPLQHGHLVSSRLLHPLPQHPQPMAALLLLTFLTSGGLTVTMVTWQSFSQHGVCSDVHLMEKCVILPFSSCDNHNHSVMLTFIKCVSQQQYLKQFISVIRANLQRLLIDVFHSFCVQSTSVWTSIVCTILWR